MCIHYQEERGVVYVGGRKGTSTKVGTGHLDVRDGHKKARGGGFIERPRTPCALGAGFFMVGEKAIILSARVSPVLSASNAQNT